MYISDLSTLENDIIVYSVDSTLEAGLMHPSHLVQKALRLLDEVEDSDKEEGLILVEKILSKNDKQLVELGYHDKIFTHLIKVVQFDDGTHLPTTINILQNNFHEKRNYRDQLAETLIYRVARSTDYEVSRLCLESISSLISYFDDSLAKHSKQILKLVDLNGMTELNPLYSEILLKMKLKLPMRKT